jgi:hypothetical protein
MGVKVSVGDVFAVPVSGEEVGLGLVCGDWNGELYLVLFDGLIHQTEAQAESVWTATPLLAALSLNAKLYHGDWLIIGRLPDAVARIPQPVFKVGVGGRPYVESRDRLVTRPATAEEAEELRYRTVVAPVRLEKALQAFHGFGEWLPHYDDLKADYALRSARLT